MAQRRAGRLTATQSEVDAFGIASPWALTDQCTNDYQRQKKQQPANRGRLQETDVLYHPRSSIRANRPPA